jgi:hypothetical protein
MCYLNVQFQGQRVNLHKILLSIRKNLDMGDRTILAGVYHETVRHSQSKERLGKKYVPHHRVIHLSLVEPPVHGSGFSHCDKGGNPL